MVRRNTGLFAGFDLDNNHCLRELAVALEHWLAGGRDCHYSEQMKELSPLQKGTVEMVAQRMALSPLLTEIITPFLQSPRVGGSQHFAAARDLRDYAVSQAEEPRAASCRDALAAWQDRRPLRMANDILSDHDPRTRAAMREANEVKRRRIVARGVVEDDGGTDDEVEANKKTLRKLSTDVAAKVSKEHAAPTPRRRAMRLVFEQSKVLDSGIPSDQKAIKGNKSKEKQSRGPGAAGDLAVDDGTIDFKRAVAGVEDSSQLTLDFNTTRPELNDQGSSIPGDQVYNRYHLQVDFSNKESVKRLNTWRHQILRRNFPPARKARVHWLESEKDLMLELMKAQLERHKYLKWNRLTNNYNIRMAGVTQHAGEKFLASGSRKSEILKEDRKAPWRTKSAIMGIFYKWQMHDMLEAYCPTLELDEEKDREGGKMQGFENHIDDAAALSSGDDVEEIPDPNPRPPDFIRRRKTSSTRTCSAGKSTQTLGPKRKRQYSDFEDEEGKGNDEDVDMNNFVAGRIGENNGNDQSPQF